MTTYSNTGYLTSDRLGHIIHSKTGAYSLKLGQNYLIIEMYIQNMIFNFLIKLKFIYSEKATKFCEISTMDLTVTTKDKSMVEISLTFVAFSEYMNFI